MGVAAQRQTDCNPYYKDAMMHKFAFTLIIHFACDPEITCDLDDPTQFQQKESSFPPKTETAVAIYLL